MTCSHRGGVAQWLDGTPGSVALHGMVCAGGITLHASEVGIATNWQALYKRVLG